MTVSSIVAANFLTVVSGLPRSGTSMMMRMLEVGGMPPIIDNHRVADEDNPNGYYEFEAVKKTKEDCGWLVGSEGKAVKMVYRLLYDLPSDREYRVLFMTRNLQEVLSSQRVMLERNGLADGLTDEKMEKLFRSELKVFQSWLPQQSHIKLIEVDYNRLQQDARRELQRVAEFLDGGLDVSAMAEVVDRSLYRNRK